jgi:DNA-binding transcriptional MerR regulator
LKGITEVSQMFGVTTRTIRYYEELGLLSPSRTDAQIRVYDNSEIAKMKLITRGKQFGFNLEEIKEMVLLFREDRSGRKQLERTIAYGTKRITEVESRIQELQDMKAEMELLLINFSEKLNKLQGGANGEKKFLFE